MAATIIATPSARRPRRAPAQAPAPCAAASCDGTTAMPTGLADHERAVIDAALAIIDHHLRARGASFDSPKKVKDYLRLQLGCLEHEVFGVLFLDSQHHLIAFEQMFRGTLARTTVHPREIVKRALALNAGAVILAHNHPSGTAEPSRADELVTSAVREALQLVDVCVLDHLVVGCGQVMSLAERGLL